MNTNKKIIALTGAESTGKSTLSEALAKHYDVPFYPEFARNYIRDLGRNYTYADIEYIARQQLKQYEESVNSNHTIIILDTWLLITKIWFETVYEKSPVWLDKEILKNHIDLFLVCDIDLPWMPDEVRENGGNNRIKLHNQYLNIIQENNFNFQIVQGQGENRVKNAIRFIDEIYK